MPELKPLRLVLLTHATEFGKPSNTGAVAAAALQHFKDHQVEIIAWSRVAPDPRLLAHHGYALLYPSAQATVLNCDEEAVLQLPHQIHSVVVIDATWQLAQKMFNQSPYLQQMPAMVLHSAKPSVYRLRRNQRDTGWCTAECVAMVLQKTGAVAAAAAVTQAFNDFNLPQGERA